MSKAVGPKELEHVLRLEGPRRYAYWIKQVADWQLVWGLYSDGWALVSDDRGQQAVPVWPHAAFASACASGPWAGYEPRDIDLSAWMERWLPGMLKDGKQVAVFPTPRDKGVVVSPEQLQEDLAAELTLYE